MRVVAQSIMFISHQYSFHQNLVSSINSFLVFFSRFWSPQQAEAARATPELFVVISWLRDAAQLLQSGEGANAPASSPSPSGCCDPGAALLLSFLCCRQWGPSLFLHRSHSGLGIVPGAFYLFQHYCTLLRWGISIVPTTQGVRAQVGFFKQCSSHTNSKCLFDLF